MYQFLSKHPDRARRFGNAMASYEKGTGYDLKHLVDNFDWAGVGNGMVVDVSEFSTVAPRSTGHPMIESFVAIRFRDCESSS